MKQANQFAMSHAVRVAGRTQIAPAENSKPMQYSIATSWDDELLDELVSLNRSHEKAHFSEIYGAHRTSITGHGRPAYRLPQVEPAAFERHVRRALQLGLR
ncbi:MAG TPA: hypothetical protein VKA67_13035, partial [Verrucomicrobiae bacterium]|nr:hypothetical protein [Verrucomicrobiae bacterium]